MIVKANNLVYDRSRKDCKCILADSQGKVFAFVQAVDLGTEGQDVPIIKRYWGLYDHQFPEIAIKKILEQGGKWPALPSEIYK